ncbi:hypothetical protein Cs7R123_53510 [Catellatospora sp. TT07R-123]|uniref:hypothetical protein n=1 Tax=Catellatospora sp. TT07R-123 TaxID=2733863 RepID=UPI001B124179|nr:hypothetical protein [Catellatospora sp. TT07R-123]GHJ48009.1 hypothetical protein Cs7R123_53510 [Catellatospora sp. TT07R-123]
MKPRHRLLPLVATALLLAGGCSAAGSPQPPATGTPATGLPASCLDARTVGDAVGFAVHVEPATVKQTADAVNCTFLADDQGARPGANVSLLVAPARFAERALADLTAEAGRAGTTATAVPVGHGLAYESAQRTAAATVVGDRLIGVTIDGMGLSDPSAAQGAVLVLLAKIAATTGAFGSTPPSAGSPSAPASPAAHPKPSPKARTSASPTHRSGRADGGLVFDPFDVVRCTWVPRLFVDLSGHARPGVDVRIPLWATRLTSDVSLAIRAELNGSSYRDTATATVQPPEWRGSVHVSLPPPDTGDFISVAIQLDADSALANSTSQNTRRTVEGSLPTPRPSGEQSFACTPT